MTDLIDDRKPSSTCRARVPSPSDELLRWPDVRRITQLSRSTIQRMEDKGKFPKRVDVGKDIVAWRAGDIYDWISALDEKHREK